MFDLANACSAAKRPEEGARLAREFLERAEKVGASLPVKVREAITRARKLYEIH